MLKKLILLLISSFFSASLLADIPVLQLITEDAAPYSFKDANGKIAGVSIDLLKSLFSRTQINYTLAIDTWENAYESALNKPYHGVLSTAGTPERKSLFKWVGPIVTMQWVFLAKKNRAISIEALGDAKKYIIGGYKEDAVTLFLESKGFKNIRVSINNRDNASLLESGKIDLWATPENVGYLQAKNLGITDLKTVYYIESVDYYIAFNKSVPDEIVEKLSDALAEVKK